ncbi:MAG: RnfABCDGE type electron transport complex subunit D [SAR324 cluster bacterium]|nr:RnfABCDGE type electron transport complex subunit D [SAR324 cluster bacterium]
MANRTLDIVTSPHLSKGASTDVIMRNVVWALLPLVGFAVYSFGLSALLLIITTSFSCVLTEHFLCRISNRESTIMDWSALITGVLLGLTLPPSLPIWMAFAGGVVAIGLGKFAFGGLGYNVFNPALVGRVFLQAAFPAAMTTWMSGFLEDRFSSLPSSTLTIPFMTPATDGVSGATPLAAFKFDGISTETGDLAFGLVSGSAGETSAILILLGGLYLIIRKMMNWRIPVSIFLTVYLFSLLLYITDKEAFPSPIFMLFSGGLMLGAVFMATDLVASPITPLGVWVYGVLIGSLVVVIRVWGGQPEGVMYAILLANAVSPQIDKLIRPRVYGTAKRRFI